MPKTAHIRLDTPDQKLEEKKWVSLILNPEIFRISVPPLVSLTHALHVEKIAEKILKSS